MQSGFFQELKDRGLIHQTTDEVALEKQLNDESVKLYVGFDPTADSLHIGHLLPVLMLRRFQQNGHVPIALVGGGTGMIGDPSFKDQERQLNTLDTVKNWSESIKNQLSRFIDFDDAQNPAIIANNYDWLGSTLLIDFLRDVGKNFTINYMMSKESVKRRIESGISYTEFAYQLLQAYDFVKLYEAHGCLLQLGGSDQWGNITSGIELLRREKEVQGFGLTMPLITKADGTKFGKTNGKAIWLDREKTSPYEMYQFFINSEDDKVIDYLKFLTFLTPEEIMELEEKNKTQPHLREAHKALAREVITFLHGKEAYEEAVQVSQTLFSGQIQNLTLEQVDVAFEGVPTVETEENEMNILDALILVGAAKSKREAREFVNGGSVLINGERIKDLEFTVKKEDAFGQSKTVIRRGKKNYFVLKYNG